MGRISKWKEAMILEKEEFSIRRPGIIGEEKFKQYAVLIPLIYSAGIPYLLLEKRSSQLKHQPGEICFPGGKLEPGEALKECAVRETMEELNVQQQQVEVMGPADIYLSPFHLMIHPFIGVIRDYQDTFSKDEVEGIIKVPLDFFQNQEPERFVSNLISEPPEDFPYEWIPGGVKYPWVKGTYDVLFYRYEDWIIWGMTAQIVQSAVKLMEEYHIR